MARLGRAGGRLGIERSDWLMLYENRILHVSIGPRRWTGYEEGETKGGGIGKANLWVICTWST